MRMMICFLCGLALTFSVMAQELSEKAEPLNIEIEGEGAVTNKITVETGLIEDTDAPVMLKDEAHAPQRQAEKAAPSTNTASNANQSFLMDMGIQYAEEGDYRDAERAYLRALESDPENESIRFRLSTLYLMMERYPEAISIMEALIVEFPGNAQVCNNLAWAYATGEGVLNKKKALLNAREAILSNPNVSSMWNTLAEAYYMAGDYERAERSAKHAIDLMTQANPEKAQAEDFQTQLHKIQRAQKALRMLDGLDEE